MPRPSILISSGAFHYWFQTLPGRVALERYLERELLPANTVQGFEWLATFAELEEWVQALELGCAELPGVWRHVRTKLKPRLLNLAHSTVHLDYLTALPIGGERWLCGLLERLHRLTGIVEFTVHPDLVSQRTWERLVAHLPSHLTLSVENMDPRKLEYKTLAELQLLLERYPALKATFDVCHWVDNGHGALEGEVRDFIARFGERLTKIHCSLPRSQHAAYAVGGGIETYHCLTATGCDPLPREFFDMVPRGAAWVVEGVVPVGSDLLGLELGYLSRELGLAGHSAALSI